MLLAMIAGLATLGTGDRGWANSPPVVQETLMLAEPANEYQLRVATYNVFLRPPIVDTVLGFQDRASCRGKLIGATLREAPYDIVALSETHHFAAMENLRRNLGSRYGVRLFGKPESFEGVAFRPVHGGLSLLSRLAIERWYAEGYDECSGVDCLARKGFVHVVLRVAEDMRLNMIMTHANAGSGRGSSKARFAQLRQLRRYLRSDDIFQRWPTVLLGDLNIDGRLYDGLASEDYQQAMRMLVIPSIGQPSDPFLDVAQKMAMPIRSTENCTGSRLIPCSVRKSERKSRNDYILFWPSHSVNVSAEDLRVEAYPDKEARCGTPFLSDHASPAATLVIKKHTKDRRSPNTYHASAR